MYFPILSLFLVSVKIEAAQDPSFPIPQQTDEPFCLKYYHEPDEKMDGNTIFLSKEQPKNESREAAKASLQESVDTYANIVCKLEAVGPKLSVTVINHYKNHLAVLKKLQQDVIQNPQINVEEETFHITLKYNLFAGTYY